MRERLRQILDTNWFQRGIVVLIAINAVILGLETEPAIMAKVGGLLIAIDSVILAVFVLELAMKVFVQRVEFVRDPWNIFDTVVVGIALVPASDSLSVLRALRILRALRLVSAVPRMRLVVQALLGAIPGIGSIAALMLLLFYVAAVIATKLFGADFPEWFGSVPASMYSLFQIMTLESWSMGIVRPVMAVHAFAWAFFVPFILIATFTMLNLFIAVVVSAMQAEHEAEQKADAGQAQDERKMILVELQALRREVSALRESRIADSQ